MIKNFIKIIIIILSLFILFIGYFSYFGITTTKFNSIIIDQIKKQNNNLDVDLKKVKLHLDLKNISIKIKTKNPKLILKNSNDIELKEISSSIFLSSYLQNKFAIKNLSIKSKNNEISSYINFSRLTNNSIQLILLNQFVKSGMAQINIDLNFDDSGKIKNNFNLTGKISNAKLQIYNKENIKELNFNFSIRNNDYKFEKILFIFKKIKFNSDFLNIKKTNDKFFVKGNLKNKKNKINNDLIFLIFNDNLENIDFSNTKFDLNSEFTFDLSKKLKIRNLKVDSRLNLDELNFNNDLYAVKNYIKKYNNFVKLKENKLHIKYSNQKILIDGSSEFYIEDNFKNLIKFQIEKSKKNTKFKTFLNLENLDIKAEDISYNKLKKENAILQISGFKNEKKLFFRNISYKENKNTIEINNLEIKNNKILNINEVRFDYLTKNNFKNQITLIKKK